MCHITEAFRPKTATNPLSLVASVYSLIFEEKFLLQHPLHCIAETLESLAANGGTYRKNSDVVELALPHDPQQRVILWPDGN